MKSENIREEIIKRYDNGNKKLFVKYRGEGVDEDIVERITYNENGDILIFEKPLDKIKIEKKYNEKGELEVERNYKYGVEIGYIKYTHFSDGGIWRLETYNKNGVLDGKWGWYYDYENGKIDEEGNYKDGLEDGKWKGYYENGQISFEINYKYGLKDGKEICYYEDGQIKEEINNNDGNEYLINFWNKDGELLVKDGDGKYTIYYENGQIEIEGNYKDGKLDGKWKIYYEDGQIRKEENYKDGEKDGKWIYYNEDGSIKEVKNYKDGKLVK